MPGMFSYSKAAVEREMKVLKDTLPPELWLRGIHTLAAANRFLREHYIADFNARFQVPPAQRGSAFVCRSGRDLDLFFAL
jgi:hypothetical protein